MTLLKTILITATTFLISCGNDPIENFNEAVKLANQNNWKEAKSIAADVVSDYPTKLTEGFYATCLEKTAKLQEAQAIFTRLAKENPQDATIHFLCGHSFISTKDYKKAYAYLRKSYELDPSNEQCLVDLFQVGIKLNTPETVNYFSTLKKMKKYRNHPVILNNAAAYLNRTNPKKSLRHFYLASKKKSASPAMELNLAINYDQLKQYSKAISIYKKYLDHTAKSATAPEAMAVSIRIQDLTEYLNNK
ncbi:MAG: hypothetical protein KAG98_05950 [Lentisphaeria bacterium]|nr:hypothetical protein [Lentisphaeria bacterium]